MKKYLIGLSLFFSFLPGRPVMAQSVAPIKVTASNAAYYRDTITKIIFGPAGLPYDILPDSVITNVNTIDNYPGTPYSSIMYPAGNLDSIDKFVVSLSPDITDFPSTVKAFLFHPHLNNGKLFIYHSGHCSFVNAQEDISSINHGIEPGRVIPALLAKGYTVLAVPMFNYKFPSLNGIYCGYNNHDNFFDDNHYSYPLSFFFKPLIASLNYINRSSYDSIFMCGLSGGGWTSTLYPAIDTSIIYSFPVAGSWPMPVRERFYPVIGDYEQYYPRLFFYFLDYQDIYTLACLPSRRMLQIHNRYDPCCFGGTEAHLYYVDSVAKALQGSAGTFKFYLDESTSEHTISEKALSVIFSFIEKGTASLVEPPPDTILNNAHFSYDIKNNFINSNASDILPELRYSLLKGPAWLNIDTIQGQLFGTVPPNSLFAIKDTISFKVEDSTGQFVVYNYIARQKRSAPFFFTKFEDNSSIYFLPPFSNSLDNIDPLSASLFYFNNPGISITGLSVENRSLIKISLNAELSPGDSIGYGGSASPYALKYTNGARVGNFGLTGINLGAVTKNPAIAGMIRFNTGTKKFEYFNGVNWIEMN